MKFNHKHFCPAAESNTGAETAVEEFGRINIRMIDFVFVWGSYENLIGRPMKTGIGPVKRQFLTIEHCENDMLHCCAARFSFLLTFIHCHDFVGGEGAAPKCRHGQEPGVNLKSLLPETKITAMLEKN